ncbi:RIP metalloprotease RseP [Catenibacillus scindens]|uniref:RIP metalloprotease RseP n=1 Tax=Catenibacillus scindens TaxID=673271 RepID=UPI00320808DD
MGIILAFIIFSVMIIIHELGHFLLARQHGITVTEFAVGMGPKLLSHKSKKSGTVYALKLVPFGGSCMMLGEDEDENSEGSFNTKSVWARMSVVLAGPIFNFFLAFIFAMIILANTGYQNTAVGSVEEGTPAAQAGLQAGDVITRIGNERVHLFKEISLYMYLNPNEPYDITYTRDGQTMETTITPFWDESTGSYRIGIVSSPYQKANILQLFEYGFYEVKYNITTVIKSLGMLFTGQLSRDDVAGPVGIVTIIDDSYQASKSYGALNVFLVMSQLIVMLSANLGVMNLLPVPALDGGRFLFLIVEAIRGKPFDREKEGLVNFVGFALLMILMVFILFNDVSRLFA